MAIYYAIVRNGCIQYDYRDGRLEVFEERSHAEKASVKANDIVEVEILISDKTNHTDALEA